MKIKTLILFVNLFLFMSCIGKQPNESQSIEKAENSHKIINQIQQDQNFPNSTEKTSRIYDDNFIIRVIENDLTLDNLTEVYRPKEIHEKLQQNKFNPAKKDTLMIFITHNDSIGFYKGWGNVLPIKIVINSKKLVIDKNIKIGVTKKLFEQKFHVSFLSDTLIVQDIEGGNILTFYFQENRLIKILYKAKYTD